MGFDRYIFRCLLFTLLLFGVFSFSCAQPVPDSEGVDIEFVPRTTDVPDEKPTPFDVEGYEVEAPAFAIAGVEEDIVIKYTGKVKAYRQATLVGSVNGQRAVFEFTDGEASLVHDFGISEALKLKFTHPEHDGEFTFETQVPSIPLWLSIIPPLLAIVMALVFREVITALFTGIFVGGAVIHVYISGVLGVPKGLLSVLDTYILSAVADTDHVSVILFSMLIGAIVAVISRNGGMKGVVDRVARLAKNAQTGQFATWFLGVAIFFDDYANTLVVGNTMRPVTDRLRISREKLAYLVDSTAAPISAIAFITTWIGAELGYIEGGLDKITAEYGAIPGDPSPYGVFLSSLEYSFYPLLTLLFMLFLIYKKRDFGPMHAAEIRARETGQVSKPAMREGMDQEKAQELDDLEPVRGAIPNPWNAILPIAVVIFGTVVGLWYTGSSSLWSSFETDPDAALNYQGLNLGGKLSLIIGAADSYSALLWSSLLGLGTALLLTLTQKIMKLDTAIDTVLGGFKTMMHAMIILILAWALANVTEDLHTAEFITQLLGGSVPLFMIPVFTFVLAALVSFSTGSSWGTMAILYPLIIPACWSVGITEEFLPEEILPILYNTVACVLAGSVLGDHCSPISDTTILSSLASNCNHIDHVRTQLPYALTVGVVGTLIGTLPAALGWPFWITFPLALAVLYGIVHFLGKPVPDIKTAPNQ